MDRRHSRPTILRRCFACAITASVVVLVGFVCSGIIIGDGAGMSRGDAPSTAFLGAAGRRARSWTLGGHAFPQQRTKIVRQADTKLYEVLGIDKDATVSEIKKAYYREARISHPDANANDDGARARFQEVAEAYATLADPTRRQQYDLQGLAGLAYLKVNSSKLFGPPPWRVLIGKTDHWLWTEERRIYMLGLLATAIPNGIAGVTPKTIAESYNETVETNVAVLLDRVSEAQAKDTVDALEDYGLAVKAEPIEGERSNENESPLMYFRRIQRELGEAAENLRQAAMEHLDDDEADEKTGESFLQWVEMVKSLRSELRAAAKGLEEFRLTQTGAAK